MTLQLGDFGRLNPSPIHGWSVVALDFLPVAVDENGVLQTAGGGGGGGLTNAELRASPVPVSGTFFQATQPISAASLPLPTGAATAANQTTELASLASIDGKLTNPLPVSAASLPLPSGAATAARQDTGNTSLASLDAKFPALSHPASQNITAVSQTAFFPTTDFQSARIKISGTYAGLSVIFVALDANDDVAFVIAEYITASTLQTSVTATLTDNSTQAFTIPLPPGTAKVGLVCAAITSGTAVVDCYLDRRVWTADFIRSIFSHSTLGELAAATSTPAAAAVGLVVREAARGQQTMAASMPVTIASDQPLALPSNAAQESEGNLDALVTHTERDRRFAELRQLVSANAAMTSALLFERTGSRDLVEVR